MKDLHEKKYSFFLLLFIMIMFFPLFGKFTDKLFPLNGHSTGETMPKLNVESVINGKFQSDLDEYLKNYMDGRNLFIKVYSQMLYSLFGISSNDNVVIGSNSVLFEPEYLDYNYNVYGETSDTEIITLVSKLNALNVLLEEYQKELYVFITPSKARYCYEDAPYYYKLCGNTINSEIAYDKFVNELALTNLKVFDSIQYINEHHQEYEFPLWYASGIHWSRALGSKVAEGFNLYLKETSKFDLSQISSSIEITEEYESPDADLYETLNLFSAPEDETFYKAVISVQEGQDKPNVFLRGGSFMGQSLQYLVLNGVFNKNIHFENNYYFTNRYSTSTVLSNFNAYDEIDIPKYLSESDILILEVNENKIWTMSWGFIDYILEHPECVRGER